MDCRSGRRVTVGSARGQVLFTHNGCMLAVTEESFEANPTIADLENAKSHAPRWFPDIYKHSSRTLVFCGCRGIFVVNYPEESVFFDVTSVGLFQICRWRWGESQRFRGFATFSPAGRYLFRRNTPEKVVLLDLEALFPAGPGSLARLVSRVEQGSAEAPLAAYCLGKQRARSPLVSRALLLALDSAESRLRASSAIALGRIGALPADAVTRLKRLVVEDPWMTLVDEDYSGYVLKGWKRETWYPVRRAAEWALSMSESRGKVE